MNSLPRPEHLPRRLAICSYTWARIAAGEGEP